jgi:hypothetical protein
MYKPPVMISLIAHQGDNIRDNRIDTTRRIWRCGEHAAMCAFWLSSYYSKVYIITSFFDNGDSHTVCTVKLEDGTVGTFDFTYNKFHPSFAYGVDADMPAKRYAEAQPFIYECSPTPPFKGFHLYGYKQKNVSSITVLSLQVGRDPRE